MRKLMNCLSIFCLLLSISSQALAFDSCLSVDVSPMSDKLVSLHLPKMDQIGSEKIVIRVEALTDQKTKIVTPFSCQKLKAEIVCTNPGGAGDFILRKKKTKFEFETSYLNFGIGYESGLPPRQQHDEINEDYAVFREEEGEDSHPEVLKLEVSKTPCP